MESYTCRYFGTFSCSIEVEAESEEEARVKAKEVFDHSSADDYIFEMENEIIELT